MEISPSGSISGVVNNSVTINCCPADVGLSQLNIPIVLQQNNKHGI